MSDGESRIAPIQASAPLSWPQRFLDRHGRRPRVLHIGNIANYAWTNAVLMREAGVECVVLDPDFYHLASAPEWVEADVAGDLGDPFYPQWHKATVRGFSRPEWYLNGPTPFVLRELAGRESGRRLQRELYRALSFLYRRGLSAPKGEVSRFRRMLESRSGLLVSLKRLARIVTVGRDRPAVAAAQPAPQESGADPGPQDAAYLPASVSAALATEALGKFDIVVGYALGARFAAGIDHPRFASLELGTLRGLVFEDSVTGRIGARLYRSSPAVFVTNIDCLEAAARLEIPESRITPLPHPFDINRAIAARQAADPARKAERPFFLCPARHHWQSGNTSWLKGNDILIKGAAIAAGMADFDLVFIEWGEEVEQSKRLIRELGLESRCRWMAPRPRFSLWPHILQATAVVDQFAASAFGGVALETMALGKRLITRLDQTDIRPFFDTPPPVLNATTPEDVARRLLDTLGDPDDAAGHGRRMAEWMEREHGLEAQLGRQFAVFQSLVERHGPAAS